MYRIARGTTNVVDGTSAPGVESESADSLRARVLVVIRREPATVTSIAGTLGTTASRVTAAVRTLRDEHLVLDVGTGNSPVWAAKLESASTDEEVREFVRHLIRVRPSTMQELADASGISLARVRCALKALHAAGVKLVKMFDNGTTRWLLMDTVKPATLRPKHQTCDPPEDG